MASKQPETLSKLLQRIAQRWNLYDVFRDWVEMSAISVSNSVDYRQRELREARYLEIIKRYDKDEISTFAQALAAFVVQLEQAEFDDVLGRVFHELDLGNAARGQFFTPYSVCQMMAGMNLSTDEMRHIVAKNGFVTVSEPACGAGAMIVAFAEHMHSIGINYQKHMHATLVDVDPRAVHMAYLQLSMLHIPAVVILGNTLTNEEREHWYTPAHILGHWSHRLRVRGSAEECLEQLKPKSEIDATQTPTEPANQLAFLF